MESLGEKKNSQKVLVGNLEGNRSLGRDRRRWENNIKMYPEEILWEVDVCSGSGTSCCENGNELLDSVKRGEFLD